MSKIYLQFIGKSNNKFTYNNVYKYYEICDLLTISTNKNQLVQYDKRLSDYFYDNFKFIKEKEYQKIQRKIKLKKISNIKNYK